MSSGDRPRKKSLTAIPINDPRNSFDVEKSRIAYFKNSREVSQMTSPYFLKREKFEAFSFKFYLTLRIY